MNAGRVVRDAVSALGESGHIAFGGERWGEMCAGVQAEESRFARAYPDQIGSVLETDQAAMRTRFNTSVHFPRRSGVRPRIKSEDRFRREMLQGPPAAGRSSAPLRLDASANDHRQRASRLVRVVPAVPRLVHHHQHDNSEYGDHPFHGDHPSCQSPIGYCT